MGVTHSVRLADQGGTRIELHVRRFDGVETEHGTVVEWDLDEAKTIHEQLGVAIAAAQINHVARQTRRRAELEDRRRQIESELAGIDRELSAT